jgi:CBS domain-containing protein
VFCRCIAARVLTLGPTESIIGQVDLARAELVRFLGLRPPFDALGTEELSELAAEIELEFHPAGAAILTEDGGPVTYLRVINAGAVSIVHDGRLLDVLAAGDSFGHDAMLAGMAPGFAARATEDTLCYRIPAAAARPLLDRARARELARSAGDPGNQAVVTLMRRSTVRCGPEESIGAAAAKMTEAGTDAVIVDLPVGLRPGQGVAGFASHLGIVTDRDLRSRVIAAGLGAEAPLSAVMTTPVFTVTPDRLGADVMFELLERGIRHAPVVTRSGRLVGVVTESDLSAPRQRAWFGVRQAITAAGGVDALGAAAIAINPIVAELHAARVGALDISRVLSALTDALVVRALELATASASTAASATTPPAGPGAGADAATGLVWIALTSHARRELTPASMPVGAIVCERPPADAWVAAASRMLEAGGLPAAITVRSPARWLAAEPEDARATMVLCDRRPVWGALVETELPTPVGEPHERQLARLAAAASRAGPVPTGFGEDGRLAGDGASRARVDIQAAAVAPIQALARWSGAAAGELGGSTPERLAAGAAAGVLEDADARALSDAFAAAFALRMTHQMEQIGAGRPPDDIVATATLSPFMRGQLREIFRTVSAVQRRLR